MKQTSEITRATANTQQYRKDTPCIEMEDVTVRFDGKTVLEKFSFHQGEARARCFVPSWVLWYQSQARFASWANPFPPEQYGACGP